MTGAVTVQVIDGYLAATPLDAHFPGTAPVKVQCAELDQTTGHVVAWHHIGGDVVALGRGKERRRRWKIPASALRPGAIVEFIAVVPGRKPAERPRWGGRVGAVARMPGGAVVAIRVDPPPVEDEHDAVDLSAATWDDFDPNIGGQDAPF